MGHKFSLNFGLDIEEIWWKINFDLEHFRLKIDLVKLVLIGLLGVSGPIWFKNELVYYY